MNDEAADTRTAGTALAPAGERMPAARPAAALAIGATAVGTLALGALAVGALAVGRLAVGRLALGRIRLRGGEAGELRVTRLIVAEVLTPRQRPPREIDG